VFVPVAAERGLGAVAEAVSELPYVLMKLGVRDRVQAVVLGYESGVVEPGGTSSE
jgi:hypothetical protein